MLAFEDVPLEQDVPDIGVVGKNPVYVSGGPRVSRARHNVVPVQFTGNLLRRLNLHEAFEDAFDHGGFIGPDIEFLVLDIVTVGDIATHPHSPFSARRHLVPRPFGNDQPFVFAE